jgi:hypothetical protein
MRELISISIGIIIGLTLGIGLTWLAEIGYKKLRRK